MITARQLASSLLSALMATTFLLGAAAPVGADPAAEPSESEPALRPGQIVTIAGTGEEGYSGDGGDALDARLNDWLGLSVADDGSLYVADTFNKRLRRVSPDGVIDTVEGTRAQRSPETDGPTLPGWGFWSPSNAPRASALGPDGSLYVAADDDIRRIDPNGVITVIAGAGEVDIRDTGVDGGLAVDSWIYEPTDIDVDDAGNVYVADSNGHRIRKIDTAGVITTVAGGGEVSPRDSEGLAATGANLYEPTSVAVDSAGTVFFTIEGSGAVYKVDATGILTMVTGTATGFAGDGGPSIEAKLSEEEGRHLTVDAEDNLYLTDGDRIRMVDPEGIITTVGPRLPGVGDIAVGPAGDLYFTSGSEVMMLVRSAQPADGEAGADEADEPDAGESPWADDEPGTVVDVAGAPLDREAEPEPVQPVIHDSATGPRSLAVDAAGAFYYADTERHVVNKVAPDGTISTIAGTGEAEFTGDAGPAAEAALSFPRGVAVDDAGNVYVADLGNSRVRKIDTSGVISTVAGATRPETEEELPDGDGGPATAAFLGSVTDVALGPDGSVYLADSGQSRIRKVDPAGVITTIAGGGDLWAKDGDNAPAVQASLWDPTAVDVDGAGNVYFIENGHPNVRMVRTDGVLVTIAGDSYFGLDEGGFAGDGGPAVAAELNTPLDVEVGPDGTVYVADTFNSRIRAVDPGGVITTIAGTGSPHDSGDDGPAVEAGLAEPTSLTLGADGTVYLTGPRSDAIRAIAADGTISTVVTTDDDSNPDDETSPAIEATLTPPMSIAAGADGELLVASGQRVDAVDAEGAIRPLTTSDQPFGARIVTTTDTGDTYALIGSEVVRVFPDGARVTVAGGGPEDGTAEDGQNALTASLVPADLAVGPDGTLYIADLGHKKLFRLGSDGTLAVVADLAELQSVRGIAAGPDGTLFVADYQGHRVYSVDADGVVAAAAGTGESTITNDENGDGGPATEAVLSHPEDVAVDAGGTLYVSESYGIRRVSDGTITTVLDAFTEPEDEDEVSETIHTPTSLAIGAGGDLYFADMHTHQVRLLVRPAEIAGPFPWLWVGLGGGVVLLAGIVVLVIRRRQAAGPAEASVSGADAVGV